MCIALEIRPLQRFIVFALQAWTLYPLFFFYFSAQVSNRPSGSPFAPDCSLLLDFLGSCATSLLRLERVCDVPEGYQGLLESVLHQVSDMYTKTKGAYL